LIMDRPEFKKWDKIYRKGKGEYFITEKIDGTNAQIVITEDGGFFTASRSRYITPDDDNYGFSIWAHDNKEELLKLGVGHHYGEWAGEGINKNNHKIEGKEFYLFNAMRWGEHNPNTPACCKVVPFIMRGTTIDTIDSAMELLLKNGSMVGNNGKPEGVVAYNTFIKRYQKATFESPNGKWESNE